MSICSTDCTKIATIAQEAGLSVPFLRPSSIAKDESTILSVIQHSLNEIPQVFSHVLLVQATSPFVSKQQINSAVNLMRETHADSVITGYKSEINPSIMFSSDDSSSATFLLPKSSTSRRQDFENYYVRGGNIYLLSTSDIHRGSIYGKSVHF